MTREELVRKLKTPPGNRGTSRERIKRKDVEEDPEREWDDEENVPLSCLQKCGIGLLCTVLTLYFLPMLSFIPLALFGGLQVPHPKSSGYNPLANRTNGESGLNLIAAADGRPKGVEDVWYWDLTTDAILVVFMPFGLLGCAYFLKSFSSSQ